MSQSSSDIPLQRDTVHQDAAGKPGLVPFQRFFGVLGYAVFCFVFVLGFLEGGSWLVWTVRQQGRSPHGTLSRSSVNPAARDILARARGQRGQEFNPASDELSLERMGGAAEYKRWVNQMSASTAYDRSDWADEFWTLERERLARWSYPYEPFRVWGSMKWQGKYVNNIETEMGVLRRTDHPSTPSCAQQPPLHVWIFGGSTIWGVGMPDAETVPSQLARQVNATGKTCLEVTNFGVEGYVSNQELIFLMQQLKAGRRPDIAIFFDGINDAAVGGVGRLPGGHDYLLPIKAVFETGGSVWATLGQKSNFLRLVRGLRRRFEPSAPAPSEDADLSTLAKATLDNYEANVAIVRMLGEKYGFKTWFFWQPTLLYGSKPLDPFEKALLDEMSSHDAGQAPQPVDLAVRAVYEEAERRSKTSGDFVFLGHVFDDVREPVYIDWVHVGPLGNQLVAEEFARRVQF